MAGLFDGAPPPFPDQSPRQPSPPDRQKRFTPAPNSAIGQLSLGPSGRLQSILGDDWPWSVLAKSSAASDETPIVSNPPDAYPSHGRSLTAPKLQTDRILIGQVDLGAADPFNVLPTIDVAAKNGDTFMVSATAPTKVAKTGMPFPVDGSAKYHVRTWSVDKQTGRSLPDVDVNINNPFAIGNSYQWRDSQHLTIKDLPSNSSQLTKAGMQPNVSQAVRFSFVPTDFTPKGTVIQLWKLPSDTK